MLYENMTTHDSFEYVNLLDQNDLNNLKMKWKHLEQKKMCTIKNFILNFKEYLKKIYAKNTNFWCCSSCKHKIVGFCSTFGSPIEP